MRRGQKLPIALGIALFLHALALLYGFAPRLDGLVSVADGAAPTVAGEPASSAADAAADDDIAQGAGAALDIDWPAPGAAPPETPAAVTPREPARAAVKPSQAARPATEPVEQQATSTVTGNGEQAGATVISADASYANRVRQHLARYAGALPPGASGEARVQFVVQPDGRVSNVLLVMRSGNAGLDSVALSLPTLAQPLPLPGPLPQRLEVPVQAIATAP
ncbi:MAG: TonB family protein [Pseudomonadota bacterium]